MNVARQAALKAGLPVEVPGRNGQSRLRLRACRRSCTPSRRFASATSTRSWPAAPSRCRTRRICSKGARWGYRMGNAEAIDSMLSEGLTCAINACHMGITAEEVASRYNVSRADQDAFAAESQRRAGRGDRRTAAFEAEIVPVDDPAEEGRAGRRRGRRISARRHDGREAGGAEAGVQEGRHGHGRQRLGHQRRRGRAGGRDRARRPGRWARRRWRESCRTRRPASIRRSWASGRSPRCARRSSAPA